MFRHYFTKSQSNNLAMLFLFHSKTRPLADPWRYIFEDP